MINEVTVTFWIFVPSSSEIDYSGWYDRSKFTSNTLAYVKRKKGAFLEV